MLRVILPNLTKFRCTLARRYTKDKLYVLTPNETNLNKPTSTSSTESSNLLSQTAESTKHTNPDLATAPPEIKNLFPGLREQSSVTEPSQPSRNSDGDIDPIMQEQIKELSKDFEKKIPSKEKSTGGKGLWILGNPNDVAADARPGAIAADSTRILSNVELPEKSVPPISDLPEPDITQTINQLHYMDNNDGILSPAQTKITDKAVKANFDNVLENRKNALKILQDVPGPEWLKLISKIWNIIPFLGSQISLSVYRRLLDAENHFQWHRTFIKPSEYFFKKYGSIVHLAGPFGGNVIMLCKPHHMASVFKQEDKLTMRSAIDCLEKYRSLDTRPIDSKMQNWQTSNSFEQPQYVQKLHDQIERTSDEMVRNIGAIRNRRNEVPANVTTILQKFSFECAGYLIFSKRFGFLESVDAIPTSEALRLYDAVNGATEAIEICERGMQLWRLFRTPAWVKLVENMDVIDRINSKYIREIEQENKRHLLIEHLLHNDQLSSRETLTCLADMLIIGVNSTTSALAFALYNLATNARAQFELSKELRSFLPKNDSPITIEVLDKMVFLKACVTESLRLNPPMPYLSRVTQSDIDINQYRIPKGTYVLMANRLACLREENFLDSSKFKPERWLNADRNGVNTKNVIHPLATIPFGYGKRSCVAKDFAEMQLAMGIAKIVRRYLIEYHYGEMGATNSYIAMPAKALKFQFTDRYG